jgi:hypothetical protein
MRSIIYLSILLCVSVLYAQELAISKLDTTDYFDFWEGSWEGTWPEGDKVGKAINIIEWRTGGKVLQENFTIYEGQNKGFEGVSISVYNTRMKAWKQAWADNQGGYFDFVGAFDGDKRIFQTQPRDQYGKTTVQRMVFYNITKDAFTWDWEASTDGGETWTLNWRIDYTRKK